MAEKAGYTNVKVYTAGLPAWKKKKLLVGVKNSWVSKNLDEHHVIIDVRSAVASRIPGAVHFTPAELQAMGKDFKARKLKSLQKILPGLGDKKAPIIVYVDDTYSPEAVKAYRELMSWKYKSVAVLEGGLKQWKQKGLPLTDTPPASRIVYVKKLAPGEVSAEEFAKLAKAGSATILDVRTDKEYGASHMADSLHFPLENLEAGLASVPKNKPVLIHCVSGGRAQIAFNLLKNKGYTNARFLNATI